LHQQSEKRKRMQKFVRVERLLSRCRRHFRRCARSVDLLDHRFRFFVEAETLKLSIEAGRLAEDCGPTFENLLELLSILIRDHELDDALRQRIDRPLVTLPPIVGDYGELAG